MQEDIVRANAVAAKRAKAERLRAQAARLEATADRWESEDRARRAWERSPAFDGHFRAGRLTPDQVREVRALTPKWGSRVIADMAARLGVHPNTLYAIRAGRIYRDVT